ncbi:hypothetical protein ACFV98_10560 [Streptomyces violascens]|uniref:hypothetical protein n=1 Tax=Streptomyces violascens TaxID=67381 RepID=UPI00365B51F5
MKRLLLASLLLLTTLAAPTAAAQPSATAHRRSTEPSPHVRTTRWQTGSTYYIDGTAWTPHAVVRTYVEGWEKAPTTRQWSQDTTDANGAFSFQRYEPYNPYEHGLLHLYMVDSVTGRRNGVSVPLP